MPSYCTPFLFQKELELLLKSCGPLISISFREWETKASVGVTRLSTGDRDSMSDKEGSRELPGSGDRGRMKLRIASASASAADNGAELYREVVLPVCRTTSRKKHRKEEFCIVNVDCI